MKIAIFGGTFNPIHNEHVKICIAVKEELQPDKIIVLPSGNPPHKNNITVVDGEHRYNMAKLAFKDYGFAEVSDYELKLDRPSYTYLTLQYFKNIYPDSILYFVMGADSLVDFNTWREHEKILTLCTLVVCGREGVPDEEFDGVLKRLGSEVIVCDYTGEQVSSSEIRVFLEFDRLSPDSLPAEVYEYIKKNQLYCVYSKYIEKLTGLLNEKRYIHTMYTVIEAVKLAKLVGCDENKAFIAATLHDSTKKLSMEELKVRFNFELNEQVPEPVVHAISGCFVAEHYFGIDDEDILNSIRYHTTARPGMSLLEKVIYVADCIEQTRDYHCVGYLRNLTYSDFNKGFTECLRVTIDELASAIDRKEVSELTLKAYEYYTKDR